MNERIAEIRAKSLIPTKHDGYVSWVFSEQKFAELIVKECAIQCDPEPGIKYSPNTDSTMKDCKKRILGHFGLE